MLGLSINSSQKVWVNPKASIQNPEISEPPNFMRKALIHEDFRGFIRA
jgi:hypothetical protein